MKILIVSILCVACALANPAVNIQKEGATKVDIEVTVVGSNLVSAAHLEASTILANVLGHYDTSADVAKVMSETFVYLSPNCIWSTIVDLELAFHNVANGVTGYVLMQGIKGNNTRFFHVYSSPLNGQVCKIPPQFLE